MDRVVSTRYGCVVVREFRALFDTDALGIERGDAMFAVFDAEDNEHLANGMTPAGAVNAAIRQIVRKLGYRL